MGNLLTSNESMKKLVIRKLVASSLLSAALILNPTVVWGLTLSAPSAPSAPTAPSTPSDPTAPFSEPAAETTSDATGNTTETKQSPTPETTSATNTGNGSGSSNTSDVEENNDTEVDVTNNADIENNLEVDVDTGNNEAKKNMGDGVIGTGDAVVDGSLVNDINNTLINIDGLCGCGGGGGATNSDNGSGSENNASTTTNSTVDLSNTNNLYLVNNEGIGANTGANEADKNMGDGVVSSGDADISFTTINFGNNTGINLETVNFDIVDTRSEDLVITWPTVGSGSGFGTSATNSGNGSDSTNNASSTTNSDTTINNENNLLLDNNVTIYANTGENSADKNMGTGIIDTGDANIANNIINFLNNNIVAGAEWLLSTVNIYGEMSGNIILPRESDLSGCGCASDLTASNTGNGSDSTNTAITTSSDTTTVNNLNNAVINNNLGIDANTGGNSTSDNMGSTSIATGDLDVNSNLVTVANTNTVGQGDTWWLVLVNNQGEWTGQIIGANDGDTIDGSGMTFGLGPNGEIIALNSDNGSGSTNDASATSNSTTTINNTNNATINNNVNIVANTGNNSADKNMQGASINTGDINVASNIVNFINNNFVGKKFVITVVNIFGKFSGNIVPPDQELPVKAAGGVDPASVNLGAAQTISDNPNKTKSSSSLSGSISNSLFGALSEAGKVLENTKVAGSSIEKPITKVINQESSGFNLNLALLGLAIAIAAGSTIIAKKKSFLRR